MPPDDDVELARRFVNLERQLLRAGLDSALDELEAVMLEVLDPAALEQVVNELRATLGGLACCECGLRSSGRAQGWEAHRADLEEVVVYCPECAEREFGA